MIYFFMAMFVLLFLTIFIVSYALIRLKAGKTAFITFGLVSLASVLFEIFIMVYHFSH
ncbi:MAG: hypothetical protein Q7K65_04750 [Candidatus Buchananbacteria bacterium]|nr:hypothetical protein [Candidatus Buchananbacteria bacterium]